MLQETMLKEIIILASVASVLADIGSRTQCRHDDECGVGECCYYHERPMIYSKRQSIHVLPFIYHQGGWCEKYLLKGASCSPIEERNGHCSCAPGLECKYYPFTTTASAITKRYLLPGNYLCAPIQ